MSFTCRPGEQFLFERGAVFDAKRTSALADASSNHHLATEFFVKFAFSFQMARSTP